MRGIRRFQRTMITLLVGVNILVFSTSFYGDVKAAFAQSLLAMGIVATFSMAYGFFQDSRKNKKTTQVDPTSKEN
jgi:magnesium-transporting ATPase (P-type)